LSSPVNTQSVGIWLNSLSASGYRLTGARRAVVEIMAASQFSLNPTQVFFEAHQRYPRLGLVTVYRTLEKLEELNLIQRVHMKNGCHSYIAAAPGHQHILICQKCARVEYFSGDDLTPLMETIGAQCGFIIQDHWLQLFGLCQACQSLAN
jgi:Fur family transcriptional regulator, ferric uptake regulator